MLSGGEIVVLTMGVRLVSEELSVAAERDFVTSFVAGRTEVVTFGDFPVRISGAA